MSGQDKKKAGEPTRQQLRAAARKMSKQASSEYRKKLHEEARGRPRPTDSYR